MADDIVSRVSNLKIRAEEGAAAEFHDVLNIENNHDFVLTLVGKVLTVRTYNFEAMRRTLNQTWAIFKEALF